MVTGRLAVSSLTYKDRRSHYSVLTSEKLNKLNSCKIPQRSAVTGQTTAPKMRQEDTVSDNSPEEKPTSRNLCRNQCWDRRTCTVIDEQLEAQCGQVCGSKLQSWVSLGFCEFYLQELYPVFRVSTGENFPCVFGRAKIKIAIFKNRPGYSILNKACPQEKIFYQSLTYPWERKYQTLASSSLPLREREISYASPFQPSCPT